MRNGVITLRTLVIYTLDCTIVPKISKWQIKKRRVERLQRYKLLGSTRRPTLSQWIDCTI